MCSRTFIATTDSTGASRSTRSGKSELDYLDLASPGVLLLEPLEAVRIEIAQDEPLEIALSQGLREEPDSRSDLEDGAAEERATRSYSHRR